MASTAETSAPARSANFTRYAWGVLGWNLLVILWGAYVRASGSGAGCGSHWPLCNGEVVPHAPQVQTVIEFTHRVTSGVALVATVLLALWSAVRFPRGHRVRRTALLSLVFLMAEALLGAGLVLLEFVGGNASPGRALYLSLHLVNTEFLLATLALTAWFSRDAAQHAVRYSKVVAGTLPVALLISVTGAIAALGDTLYPAASLAEGMQQDVSAAASFLVRLRVLHPVLAVFAAAYFISVAIVTIRSKPSPLRMHIGMMALSLTLAQLLAGAINLALLAPIGMQIAHLLLADLVWLSLLFLTVESSPGAVQGLE
ncbi:MAG TPA: COX15/CtaA family protein [Bryobacteraceae bacterium]|nr:COX15/CtaA family protein [Bryobacteraceae bacterium]